MGDECGDPVISISMNYEGRYSAARLPSTRSFLFDYLITRGAGVPGGKIHEHRLYMDSRVNNSSTDDTRRDFEPKQQPGYVSSVFHRSFFSIQMWRWAIAIAGQSPNGRRVLLCRVWYKTPYSSTNRYRTGRAGPGHLSDLLSSRQEPGRIGTWIGSNATKVRLWC
jgi:hypothetical protein